MLIDERCDGTVVNGCDRCGCSGEIEWSASIDDDGLPVNEMGEPIGPEEMRAVQAVRSAQEMFSKWPRLLATLMAFSQDESWTAQDGRQIEVASMDPTHAANVLKWMKRRALALWSRYSMADAIVRSTVAMSPDEQFLMATENYDDVRHFTGMPEWDGVASQEATLALQSEWSWERLRGTPLVLALQARSMDRLAMVEDFLA